MNKENPTPDYTALDLLHYLPTQQPQHSRHLRDKCRLPEARKHHTVPMSGGSANALHSLFYRQQRCQSLHWIRPDAAFSLTQ